MKGYLILLAVLFIGFISAEPTINFQHEKILSGETIIGTITINEGEFTKNIEDSEIKFFDGRKEVFFEFENFFYNESNYFYVYTTRPGNFSMKVENVLYKEKQILNSINLEKNFEVLKGNDSLSIKPGVVYLKSEPKIKLTNFGESSLNLTYFGKNKVSLPSGKSIEVSFTPITNLSYFEIDSYKRFLVPVISTITNETFVPEEKVNLKFNPSLLLNNLYVGDRSNDTIEFFNFANESLNEIKITTNIDFLEFEKIENFEARESRNVSVFFNPKREGKFQGNASVSYVEGGKEFTTNLFFSLFVFNRSKNNTITEETCEEKNGSICDLEEICQGTSEWTKGGVYCCIGICKSIIDEEPESNGWIYGILILVLIIIIGLMIYSKYKKTGRKRPEENLREITQRYQNR